MIFSLTCRGKVRLANHSTAGQTQSDYRDCGSALKGI